MTRGFSDDPTLPAVRIAEVVARPGLALVFACGEPRFELCPLPASGTLAIGRSTTVDLQLDDSTLSRSHAEVSLRDGHWTVRDTSRHGSFVDGQHVAGEVSVGDPRTLRLGDCLLAFVSDTTPYRGRSVACDGDLVLGHATATALAQVERARNAGEDLLLVGEPGTGKETLLRCALHGGPSIVADCARGALATDHGRRGLLAAARNDTLFLDELGAAGRDAQEALVAMLQAAGPTAPRLVATSTQPVEHTLAGVGPPSWLAPSLHERFARGVVRVAPLRERWEELSFLVTGEVRRAGRIATASLVERCLLRPWQDNVRGLLAGVQEAVVAAGADARRSSTGGVDRIEGRYLQGPVPVTAPLDSALEITDAHALRLDRESTERALAEAGGDVERAAAQLRVHKNTLQRHLRKLGL